MNATFTSGEFAALQAETKAPTTLAVVITFTTLSFVFVFLRYITKFVILKNKNVDDYVIGLAMVS